MRGVRVEQPPANLSATVTPPAAFAFPVTFHATRAIGLFDDNHNGGLDPVAGSSIRTFPVGDTAPGSAGPGSRIGSLTQMPLPGSDAVTRRAILAQGAFCGDSLVYAEQVDSSRAPSPHLAKHSVSVPTRRRPRQLCSM